MTYFKFYKVFILAMLLQLKVNAQTDNASFAYHKPLFDFNYKKPTLIAEGNQSVNKNRFLRSYILTGYREGVKPSKGLANFERYDDPNTGTARLAMYNLSIVEMITHSSRGSGMVILEVKDPIKYMYKSEYGDRVAWMRKNAYCFEYTMPEAMVGKQIGSGLDPDPMLWEVLQRELFDVSFKYEQRNIKVLVLVRTSNIDKIKSKGINTGGNGTSDSKGNFKTNLIGNLATPLEAAEYPPMIDETGYTGAIDMNLNISNWKDFNELRRSLQRYDLDLKEETRMVKDVLVISELNLKK